MSYPDESKRVTVTVLLDGEKAFEAPCVMANMKIKRGPIERNLYPETSEDKRWRRRDHLVLDAMIDGEGELL